MPAKYTPGPWRYEGPESGGRVIATDDRQTVIHIPPCSPFNEQAIYEGHLIAAAPDMLALLLRIIADPIWRTNDNTLWLDLRETIARAEGRK